MTTTNHLLLKPKRATMAGVALAVCLLLALAAPPGPAEAAYPAEYNGKIAYTSGGEIYVINEDGLDQTPLTKEPQEQSEPTWSPDGTKIAYTSGGEIYVMDEDGSNKTNLTNDPAAAESSPTWNSDGTKLAFLKSQPPPPGWEPPEDPYEEYDIYSNNEIYTMNADGSDQFRLTNTHFPAETGNCCHELRYSKVAWSPDDTKIAFIRHRSFEIIYGSSGLFTMDTDGSNETRLPTPDSVYFFDWSPDGSKIVFGGHNYRYGYGHYAAIMNKDGSNRTGLPHDTDIPAWSPDGSKMVFSRSDPDAGTYEGIFTMNADGTDPVYLVDHGGDFSWQPATSDQIPPNTVIDPSSGPTGTVTTNAARFDFSSTAGEANSTFECSLDDVTDYEGCDSPKEYSDLEDGEHTFRVRATDKAGNTDQSPAERTFTVDTTGPTVTTTTPAAGSERVNRASNLTIAFSEEVDPSTLTATNIQLLEKRGYPYKKKKKKGKKARVGWTYRWEPVTTATNCDDPCNTATLDPSVDLLANTDYVVVVTTGVKDKLDNAMARNHSWTFTTGSA
jgi:TolB protein